MNQQMQDLAVTAAQGDANAQPNMKVDNLINLLTETLDSLTCLVEQELSSEKYQYTMVMSAAGVLRTEINSIQSGDLKE